MTKQCCNGRCKNTFEGPGIQCQECRGRKYPRLTPRERYQRLTGRLVGKRVANLVEVKNERIKE